MWHSDKYLLRLFFFSAILFVYKQTHIESPEVGWMPQIVGSLTSPNCLVLGVSVAPQYPSCQDPQPPQIQGSLPLGCGGGDAGDAAPAVAAVMAAGWPQPQCHHCTAKQGTESWQGWGTRWCCSNGTFLISPNSFNMVPFPGKKLCSLQRNNE